jgi:hypothetical protein
MKTMINPPNYEILLRGIDRQKRSNAVDDAAIECSALRPLNCGLALPVGPENVRTV